MKSVITLTIIIAFAGIASGQNEPKKCNSHIKIDAGVQDTGSCNMSPVLGFNYSLMGKKDALGGFIEAKYLNAETITWLGGVYNTNFNEEFSEKEFESKIGAGTRTDSITELFFGAEVKMQFPYFIFNVGTELNIEKVEYEFIAQYAMCPSATYFGIIADSHNGVGVRFTHREPLRSGYTLILNCGAMSNSFDAVKSDGFGFTDLNTMIHMMIGLKF
jgi:hypothetical protein